MTLSLSKHDVCALYVAGITESWQQNPLFTVGATLSFPTGRAASQEVLTYVNGLSPQKQWRIGGGHHYFDNADGEKIVKIMYLVCSKSGKVCVKQDKEPTEAALSVNVPKRRKAPVIEGTRASKCGCKAKIQLSWITAGAPECQVGDCSWVHTGNYLRTYLVFYILTSSVSQAMSHATTRWPDYD